MKASLRKVSLSLLVVIAMGLGTYAHAEPPAAPAGYKLVPEDLTADLNVSLYSQYIWRGFELSRDSLVIFPQLTVGYKGFAATVWADLDTNFANPPDGEEKDFRLQETDVILTYSNSYKPWKLNYTLGWIYYDTDGANGRTPFKNQELFLTLGLDTLLKPTFSVYQEIEIGQAWYFTLGLSHSFAVYRDWSLDMGGWVSYLHDKSNPENFGNFHDGNISAGVKIPLNNNLSIKPNLQWSFPLSGQAADRLKAGSFNGRHNTFVYGGIILDLAI